MTRFKREMMQRFPLLNWESDGEWGAYTIEDQALIVTYSPGLVTVLRFLPNGKQREIPEWEFPEIAAPYLVYLCGGDVEEARRILKSQPSFGR